VKDSNSKENWKSKLEKAQINLQRIIVSDYYKAAKASFVLTFSDSKGNTYWGKNILVQQVKHDFHFGLEETIPMENLKQYCQLGWQSEAASTTEWRETTLVQLLQEYFHQQCIVSYTQGRRNLTRMFSPTERSVIHTGLENPYKNVFTNSA
jgi:hypothetical protein